MKIAGYIITLAGITLVVNFLYVKQDSKDNKFMSVPDEVQICNLGSSHGMFAYNYEDIESRYTCFNFALESQSLSYDERILDTYKNKICQGAVVFIDISYFSLYGHAETEDASFDSKNQRYYAFLPSDKIKKYNLKTKMLSGSFRSLSAGPLQIIKKFLKPMLSDSNSIYWSRTTDRTNIQENAEAAYRRHCVDGKTDSEGNLIKNEEEIAALFDIIRICRKIGATPVLVTTPYLSEYTDAIALGSPEFFREFYRLIESVTQEMDISYYDYSRDERFCVRYDWFMDADHLNREGARAFTGILMEEVVNNL